MRSDENTTYNLSFLLLFFICYIKICLLHFLIISNNDIINLYKNFIKNCLSAVREDRKIINLFDLYALIFTLIYRLHNYCYLFFKQLKSIYCIYSQLSNK